MRVVHVNKYLYRRGGAEAYMLDVAALQSARGHDVAVFGMQHPENPQLRFEQHFPSYIELDPPPSGASAQARATARMFWSRSSRVGMQAFLDEFDPDVVHLHNVYHQLSPSILAPLQGRRASVVMTLHDYKLVCPSYRMLDHGRPCDACVDGGFRQAVRRRCKDGSLPASAVLAAETWWHRRSGAYGRVDAFISPSRFLADTLARAGVYPDRLRVVSHPVVTRDIPVKTSPGGDVLYAGRLSEEKGVDVLIEAVASIPTLRLSIAGEGPREAELRDLAQRCAPDRVRFLGRLDRTALSDAVRAAAVVAVPSVWNENQPMAVLETFACGVPVVVTDLGGLPELVRDGVQGRVVPAGDRAALAAALADTVARPDRAMAMGRAARDTAEADFSPERHLATLEEIYRSATLQLAS